MADLEDDPFVEHALTTACCEMYYRYGMYLAPLTAAMTTAKHCRFGDRACTETKHGVPDGQGDAGASSGRVDDTTGGRVDDTPDGRVDEGDDSQGS